MLWVQWQSQHVSHGGHVIAFIETRALVFIDWIDEKHLGLAFKK